VRGNPQALFGKRPTEKDPAKGTSPAVDFTRGRTPASTTRITTAGNLQRPQEGDHPGFRPSRPSVWSRTGAFEVTGTGGPKAGPRAAGS
jgi:hypothetical protein